MDAVDRPRAGAHRPLRRGVRGIRLRRQWRLLMGEIDDLRARIEELERRVDVLFTRTGAIDMEELGRGAPDASPEVRGLAAKGDIKKAVKLYQKETGADMATAMGALGKLGPT